MCRNRRPEWLAAAGTWAGHAEAPVHRRDMCIGVECRWSRGTGAVVRPASGLPPPPAATPTHVCLKDQRKHRQGFALGTLPCSSHQRCARQRGATIGLTCVQRPVDSVQVDLCSCTDLTHGLIDLDTARTTHPARSTVAAALHLSPLPVRHARKDGAAAGRAGLRGGGGQLAR